MSPKSNSLSDFLFAFLLSARNGRLFHQILREQEAARCKEQSMRVALYRLRKTGYVINDSSTWILTERGIARAEEINLYSYTLSPFRKDSLSNTLVAYKIPEIDRRVRVWLRNQLKIFCYSMLQKSLWFGPGPLPQSFKGKLLNLGIRKNVRIFTVTNKQK